MSRRLALAATTAVIAMGVASPSWAIFGLGRKPAEAPPVAPAATATATAAATAPTTRKATPEERAQAERLDPMSRAAFWTREVEVDPRDAEAGVRLSTALRAMGQPEKALEASQRVLVVYPDHVEALLETGRNQIARGQPFYGIEQLKHARDLAPRDWRPLNLLGVAYDQTQRPAEARAAWQQALQLSPDNPAVLSNIGLAQANDGDTAEAEATLRRAVAQPGATLQTRQNLALVLGLQGKTAEAEQWLRQDLPPEMASANLAWLKAASAGRNPGARPAGVTGANPTASAAGAAATSRSWESLRSGQ
ncbi:MAG: tetratricopeptide repeat protein [Caulobacteraceae bacterium]|nr:tetratricopeptide repeat protein [Caulobacteraceae bacterium]